MGRAVLCVCALLVCAPVFAGPPPSDSESEKAFRADIAKVSADAAAAWDEGQAAYKADRNSDAEAAFRKAIVLAPNVDHLHRMLCNALRRQGRFNDAIAECERALSLSPDSPYDKGMLGAALLARHHGADVERGAQLTHEAAAAKPNDIGLAGLDCAARAVSMDNDGLSTCVDHLLTIAPEDATANLFASHVALNSGDVHRANIYLEKAKDEGLSPDLYGNMRTQIDAFTKRHEDTVSISTDDILGVGIPVVLGWCLLLVVLLMIGNALSDSTLRSAGHVTADGEPTPRERRVRRTYRVVLLLTGLLFYVSLPLLVVVVLGAADLVLAAFDEAGATPIIVLIGLGAIVLSTFIAVMRALFFVPKPVIEGLRIELDAYPKLKAVLAETADAIGTRPVDVVYLTPGTDASVTEQRSMFRALRGAKAERILVLGVALFDGMKQVELLSVLAHEYGHFRNADTGRVLEVQRSLITLLHNLAASKYALFNPAWWLLRAFTRLYLVVSRGASRLQEILADRWAIRAYGSDAFIASQRHIVRRGVEFPVDLAQTIKDVIANKWTLPNLYSYEPERRQPQAVEAEVDKRMQREPTELDTHPSTRQRLEWATQAAAPGERRVNDGHEPVWSLFPEPEQVERDMTAIIRDRIRTKMGHQIGDAEWQDDDDVSSPS